MVTLAEILWWWIVAAGLWIVTLSTVSAPEVIVAVSCALPCAVLAHAARRANAGHWRPRPSWPALGVDRGGADPR